MSDSQQASPGDAPEWGAQQPASQWNAKKTIVAVAVAVGITAAGGAAIWAASGTNAAGGGPGGMGGPPGQYGDGRRLMGPGFGTIAHGEFQTGEVTQISDSSVEVKSTDGYTKTYVIDAETVIEGVAQGDTVTVVATTADGKSTAETIIEPGSRSQRQPPPTK